MPLSRRHFLTTLGAATTLLPWSAHAGDTGATIAWQTWNDGLQQAAAHGKAMALYVYADWCPHCRELQPLFREADVVKASRSLVMVRQNADEAGPWLHERFGRYGSYVPRLFFLHPDGSLAAEIQSGNPKYPYFYQPSQSVAMRAAMKQAAALSRK